MKPLKSFEEIIQLAAKNPNKTVAIAAAWDYEVLLAALDARQQNLANCIDIKRFPHVALEGSAYF